MSQNFDDGGDTNIVLFTFGTWKILTDSVPRLQGLDRPFQLSLQRSSLT
jgi:hypothetical protein